MKYQRKRTKPKDIAYGPYLYFLGLSHRSTVKALNRFVHRSHVSVWKWVQKYKPKRVSVKRKKINEFIVDETLIKIGSEFIWLWVAIEPKDKEILSINIYPENAICCWPNAFCPIFWRNMANTLFQRMWHAVPKSMRIPKDEASPSFLI